MENYIGQDCNQNKLRVSLVHSIAETEKRVYITLTSHLSFTCQNFPGSPSAISAGSKVNAHTHGEGRAWERGYKQPQSHAFSLLLAAYLTFDPYTEQGLDCGPVMLLLLATGY